MSLVCVHVHVHHANQNGSMFCDQAIYSRVRVGAVSVESDFLHVHVIFLYFSLPNRVDLFHVADCLILWWPSSHDGSMTVVAC